MTRSLYQEVIAGKRRALAKAITLIESDLENDAVQAEELLTLLLPHSGKSLRIGISGIPGVGKSTMIEVLGLKLIAAGAKVAVLAVDPSSALSGGSVLGDKTRMEKLSVSPNAFIRPSPARGHLGGVARRTRDCIIACEAAGYDTIMIETVGIGQSEAIVSSMVDVFILLQMPHTGDELQTFKKGVLELANIIVITKADGVTLEAAQRAASEHRAGLVLRHDLSVPVLTFSGLSGEGGDELLKAIEDLSTKARATGAFVARRESQAELWLNDEIKSGLFPLFMKHGEFFELYQTALQQIEAHQVLPRTAVRQIFRKILAK